MNEKQAKGMPLKEKKTFKGPPHEPASKAKPGAGGRFRAMVKKLSETDQGVEHLATLFEKLAKAVRDPKALAAAIGRKKYGKERFQQMAAAGRKKKAYQELAAVLQGKDVEQIEAITEGVKEADARFTMYQAIFKVLGG